MMQTGFFQVPLRQFLLRRDAAALQKRRGISFILNSMLAYSHSYNNPTRSHTQSADTD